MKKLLTDLNGKVEPSDDEVCRLANYFMLVCDTLCIPRWGMPPCETVSWWCAILFAYQYIGHFDVEVESHFLCWRVRPVQFLHIVDLPGWKCLERFGLLFTSLRVVRNHEASVVSRWCTKPPQFESSEMSCDAWKLGDCLESLQASRVREKIRSIPLQSPFMLKSFRNSECGISDKFLL